MKRSVFARWKTWIRSACGSAESLQTYGGQMENRVKGRKICKACGAEILFIEHCRKGGLIPCDAEKTTIVKPSGEMVQGFIPHWATCSNPDQFRRKR